MVVIIGVDRVELHIRDLLTYVGLREGPLEGFHHSAVTFDDDAGVKIFQIRQTGHELNFIAEPLLAPDKQFLVGERLAFPFRNLEFPIGRTGIAFQNIRMEATLIILPAFF